MKSLLFDYRLAPEYPFPAGIDDCVKVYQYLLEQGYKSSDIVVGGESAGATLTLSLLLSLKEKEIALPKAAFSISPLADIRCLADSFRYNAKNDIAPQNSWNVWAKFYMGDNNPNNPLLSPIFGDFKNMPPIYICVGTHEIHLDDCINIAKKIENDRGEVTLSKWENMVHAFPIMSPLFPEAKKAMDEICEFVKMSIFNKGR